MEGRMYGAFQKIVMQDYTNASEAIYGATTQAIKLFFADYKIESSSHHFNNVAVSILSRNINKQKRWRIMKNRQK